MLWVSKAELFQVADSYRWLDRPSLISDCDDLPAKGERRGSARRRVLEYHALRGVDIQQLAGLHTGGRVRFAACDVISSDDHARDVDPRRSPASVASRLLPGVTTAYGNECICPVRRRAPGIASTCPASSNSKSSSRATACRALSPVR
jgi:hypothetical protein